MNEQTPTKSTHAEREERILEHWKKERIFEKTLEKPSPKGDFVFFEGPPTANGRPGIHHLEARAFKDAIPRYRTMRGYHVRRKGGWDTHGLPVELQVEKELGLKSKKEIESYGVAAFNDKCKDSVWTYVHEWEQFTERMGYWVDLKDPYITYKPEYIESVWNIVKQVDEKGLLYKDYKVVPWCPRCGTGLSSHELAQGYDTVKDLSVTVKFRITKDYGMIPVTYGMDQNKKNKAFILAWTTTPWTLPGNVGLAVGKDIEYVILRKNEDLGEILIVSKERYERGGFDGYRLELERLPVNKPQEPVILEGADLVGLEYEPLYPFLKDNISGAEKDKLENAYKVYAADFVTTADGTGVVHTAVMYGQDDFELGNKVGLPKYHLVNDDGTFKKEAGFLAGAFVKDEGTEVAIIKDLAHRGLLFAKEKYEHTYPFCWRCKTPLIYFARDSWYIRMSALRNELVKENEGIHWEPQHIKEGRFGEWLREIKDWAISRERYWGTPLPVWTCDTCHEKRVIGSIDELKQPSKNTYFVMRHGEAENNIQGILNGDRKNVFHLTEKGKADAHKAGDAIKNTKIDLVFHSPFTRTTETANILKKRFGWSDAQMIVDDRLHEVNFGEFEASQSEEFFNAYPWTERFERAAVNGETYGAIKKRMGDFLYEVERKHSGKNILIVTHGTPAMMLQAAARGLNRDESIGLEMSSYIQKAELRPFEFHVLPHNAEYEIDLHKPFIDEIKLPCKCGGEMTRAKEVMDVWFDSGAMPFAQDHYPFEKGKKVLGLFGGSQKLAYPADFISEAIDQTRGWFYTLHAIGTLLGKGKAYKNVICLGHILDAQGKKMSKSIGNVVNPWDMMNKYGADALRFWMYSINQPGDSKNFEEKTVDEVVKKVFNLATNVVSFYKLYATPEVKASAASTHVLDHWIISRLNELNVNVVKNMDNYVFMEPTRAIRDFIGDLSQWYLRRSRDRFKEDGVDKSAALATTKHVMLTLAKIMAPFTPFFAEELYREVGGELESVHLEHWPEAGKVNDSLLKDMAAVRTIASKGLEARTSAKINVRQPLASFASTAEVLSDDLADIIKDELNVKEVSFKAAADVLDTALTPELKEEGELRELLRKIQDMRKEKGLTVKDTAVLVVPADLQMLANKYKEQIMKTTKLLAIENGAALALK